jgi:hypothetical protein
LAAAETTISGDLPAMLIGEEEPPFTEPEANMRNIGAPPSAGLSSAENAQLNAVTVIAEMRRRARDILF